MAEHGKVTLGSYLATRLSEVGVRHVEDILWGLHYGLPV